MGEDIKEIKKDVNLAKENIRALTKKVEEAGVRLYNGIFYKIKFVSLCVNLNNYGMLTGLCVGCIFKTGEINGKSKKEQQHRRAD